MSTRAALRDSRVFVIHALHGYELFAEHTERTLGEAGIRFEYFSDGDSSKMTDQIVRERFRGWLAERPIRRLSITLNHLLLLEKIAEGPDQRVIVFEDDVCFLSDFGDAMDQLEPEVNRLSPGYLISLENSTLRFPSFRQARSGKILYRADEARCAAAYIVDRTAARAMVSEARAKIDAPIDHWLGQVARAGVIKLYWQHPPVVEQGSHNGKLSADVSGKRSSWKRRVDWKIRRAFRSTLGRLFRQVHVIEDENSSA